MSESKLPADPKQELTEDEQAEVSGGINPQPLPPARAPEPPNHF